MAAKILIISESSSIRQFAGTRAFKNAFDIRFARNATAGLVAARKLQPDLILLELQSSGEKDFEQCIIALKADSRTADIPTICMASAATVEDRIRALDLGAVDCFTAPFEQAEVQARIRAAIRTRSLIDALSKKAMIDGLTGLWNRAYLERRICGELSAARRTGQPLACVMADLDGFKSINDGYGHSCGDQVLRTIARIFQQGCRAEDVVCRYGGEEFIVLLPNTTVDSATALAERLRVTVEAHAFTYNDVVVRITCSFGVADLGEPVTPSLVERADSALYSAKRAGRNRVEVC